MIGGVCDYRARMSLPGTASPIALVITDALRSYTDHYTYSRKVNWVIDSLGHVGFTDIRDQVILTEAYRPSRQPLRMVRNMQFRDLSVGLLQSASVVVMCGGNAIAILQSFQERAHTHATLLTALRQVIEKQCLLLSWSAGTTVSGISAEMTRDRKWRLPLDTGAPLDRRGLCLIPGYSFRPHTNSSDVAELLQVMRNRIFLHMPNGTTYVTIPDEHYVVFNYGD